MENELCEANVRLEFETAAARQLPVAPNWEQPCGIVIPAGGLRYLICSWVCIRQLRDLGCRLPIELWHLGPDELPAAFRSLYAQFDVVCIDAYEVRKHQPCRILNGWELKAYAMIHSSFRNVLLIDADNVAVQDPTPLFETLEFRTTGATFWPDYGRLSATRPIWKLCAIEFRDEPEFESGQMLVDKERCWRELHLALWMNEHSDFFYRYIHGDKETFHLAWRKLRTAYSMPNNAIENLQDLVMCQHDFSGKRLFQHRNLAKWSFFRNICIAGFRFEKECLSRLSELRGLWSPEFSTRDSLPSDNYARATISERRYQYRRVGHDVREMVLSRNGLITVGAAEREVFW